MSSECNKMYLLCIIGNDTNLVLLFYTDKQFAMDGSTNV